MVYRLRLMGPFELLSPSGQPVAVVAKKSQALLAILALAEGAPVPRSRLMAVLWGDRGEEQARNSLRQALAGLRKLFAEFGGSPLRITDDNAAIDPATMEADLGNPEAARAPSEFLEGLYIAGEAAEEWLRDERQQAAGRYLEIQQRHLAHLESSGDVAGALATAQGLIAMDPLNERAHRALMRLHASVGDRSRALKQFQQFSSALKAEFGVEPDPETQALHERLRAESGSPSGTAAIAVAQVALDAADRPTIVVLPFVSLSSDPEQAYFADGITDDIITELGRFRAFNVIARNSAFHYRGQTPTLEEVGRALGVQFVLQGSIRRAGDRVRFRVELSETANGRQLWAEHFDRELGDIFAVQDEITSTVSGIVRGRLDAAIQQRAMQFPPEKLGAYDLCLRAKAEIFKFRRKENAAARALLERAIELDPNNATAHSWLATSYHMDWISFWVTDRESALDLSARHARIAVSLDSDDGRARWKLAEVLQYRGEIAEARSQFEHAMRLNPNDTHLLCVYGLFLGTFGDLGRGLSLFDRAERLDPFDTYMRPWLKGITCYHAHRYTEAIDLLTQIAEPIVEIRAWLAASNAQLGRTAEAARHLGLFLARAEEDLAIFPGRQLKDWDVYLSTIAFGEPSVIDHLVEGLSKAWEIGIEEPSADAPLPDR